MESIKEKRIRNMTHLYYSKPEVQKAMFEFSKNREICPRYFESFGKRPDSFQYRSDIFELVKKGATSFNCSEELWKEPLEISSDMTREQYNKLRIGWDLILDIDSKYIDYSKIAAKLIIRVLKFHKIKNFGVKFSGSKGFHIIVPWKAFPKEFQGKKTSDMFPEYPRILLKYINEKIKKLLIKEVTKLTTENKYVKDFQAPKEVMPDIILVSPRHLFRMPYSLHEKTALASIVLSEEELDKFELKDASPLKVKVKNFMPNAEEGEASELLLSALDWYNESQEENKDNLQNKEFHKEYKKIKLDKIYEENFPKCIKNILKGMSDGRKRALFVLINLFRSLDMEKKELEDRIYSWNKKNQPPLKEGYIKTQLLWSYKRKPLMPPNFGEFYKNLGVYEPDEFAKKIKNPVNYIIKKSLIKNSKSKNKKN